ncbi:MAG: hypothetical protein RL670_631 [Actinomycetota bacterium]
MADLLKPELFDKMAQKVNKPGCASMFVGAFLLVLGLVPMLGFYLTPHENGIASDFGAQITIAPFSYLFIALGSLVTFIGLVRWLLSKIR